jgi:ribosomal protein S27AE
MKQDNKCTKCGSTELLAIPGVPGEEPHIAVGHPVMHSVKVTRYVCGRCGYIEQWVESDGELAKLREEYGRE